MPRAIWPFSTLRHLSARLAACCVALGAFTAPAHADLYAAEAAFNNKEFERAFSLYRELAEMGLPIAQENLAVMYVSGEGVKRDNVLGYAWAKLALEQGASGSSQAIVDQLDPHLTPAGRKRIDGIREQFGQDALRARLLLKEKPSGSKFECTVIAPANPVDYFPRYALEKKLWGDVILDFTVLPDGSAHNARVLYASTALLFDHAARYVVMNTRFKPKVVNGVNVPCDMRIRVKFTHARGKPEDPFEAKFGGTKTKAEAGDPEAQFVYGLLLLARPDLNDAKDDSYPWLLKAAQAGMPQAQFLVGMAGMSDAVAEREPAKGEAWLAKSAASGQATAQIALASWYLANRTDDAAIGEARRLLEAAIPSGNFDAKYRLAGLLASSRDPAHRDPARALTLLDEVRALYQFDPAMNEVKAAALATQGDFEGAVKSQKSALSRARQLRWDVQPLEARLADYEAKKPFVGSVLAW